MVGQQRGEVAVLREQPLDDLRAVGAVEPVPLGRLDAGLLVRSHRLALDHGLVVALVDLAQDQDLGRRYADLRPLVQPRYLTPVLALVNLIFVPLGCYRGSSY